MIFPRRNMLGGAVALALSAFTATDTADSITILNTQTSNGFTFTNFDGPTPNPGGTFINGISNTGQIVGFTQNGSAVDNFTADPTVTTNANPVNIAGSNTAMANGINSSGTIVGFDGITHAFSLSGNSQVSFIPNGGTSAQAFGINDNGMIAGQYTTAAGATPGFVLNGTTVTTINAPTSTSASSEVVNVQGVNDHGLAVGFYLGTDGQDHGFMFNLANALHNVGVGVAIADPTIPNVPGEPGATFVFSQILGINDQGIAVGYYGDSTGSQHGFLYNTNTCVYTFLSDPNAGFNNGVEVTQITGINNSGEITGFYTDANGLAHGFVGLASVPEPSSICLMGLGICGILGYMRRARRKA